LPSGERRIRQPSNAAWQNQVGPFSSVCFTGSGSGLFIIRKADAVAKKHKSILVKKHLH